MQTVNDTWIHASISKEDLLAAIQDSLDEYLMAMKTNGSNSDYISGGVVALRDLAVGLGLCEYEDLLD